MFRRIFVPLDGSPRAERALPVAARLAQVSHGTVILASAITPSYNYSPALAVPANRPGLVDDEVKGAKEYLGRIQQGTVLTGIQTETMVGVGLPASVELIELARDAKADMVVMCSHGRSGLMRWALGSVAQAVVRSTPIPVLVLKAGGPIPSGTPDAAFRVLAPLDGSPLAETAIEPAARLAATMSAPGMGKVTLLQVIRYPTLPYAPFQPVDPYFPEADAGERGSLHEAATAYLHGVAQRFSAPPLADLQVRVAAFVLFSDDVAGAIAAAADGAEGLNEPSDAITMATHGRTGIQRLALGSIAERVLQSTKRPLLVVPPLTRATTPEATMPRIQSVDATPIDVPATPLF